MPNKFNKEIDYSILKALYINCTLKPSPELSHTEGLMKKSMYIMEEQGIKVEYLRLVDFDIAPGVYPDMKEYGFEKDDWPGISDKVFASNILVVGTPIWLGDKSSVCTHLIERLYSESGKLNRQGQYMFYGKTGGCIITGNEDGAKHCAMNILYSLQHLGYTLPPQADAGWLGEIGPGPSYLDKDSGAEQNDFTNRNTTFMTWNLIHIAHLLDQSGGIPAYGNQRSLWDSGKRFGYPNPEHR